MTAIVFAPWAVNDWRAFELWDSSIFLFVGEQLRRGAALYEDVWDSKPPVIFVLNTLGLTLANGSPFGVFLIDALLVFGCFAVLWRTLASIFQPQLAIFGALFGLLLFHSLVAHPNVTEVVVLHLQALSFALLIRSFDNGFRQTYPILQGSLAAVLFWTRANGVGIVLVYVIALMCVALLHRRPVHAAVSASWFAGATLAASFVIVYPFVRRSSWYSLYYASIGFNRLYADLTTLYEKIHAVLWFILLLAQNPGSILALAGVIYILVKRPPLRDQRAQILWLSLLWLGLEVCFAAFTGQRAGKNVVPWILPLSLLAAGFLDCLIRRADSMEPIRSKAIGALSIAAVLLTVVGSFVEWRANQKASPEPDEQLIPVVRELVNSGQRVLFWGPFHSRVVYRTGHPAGSRFFTSIQMGHDRLLYRALAPQALADVQRNRPEVIVDKADGSFPPLFGPHVASGELLTEPWDTVELLREKNRIRSLYTRVWSDARLKVSIYERR